MAYTPLTINDVDVTEIYAYDSSGEEYVLDGQEPPDFPVMVVGINERMGLYTSLNKLAIDEDAGGGGGGGGGSSGDYYPYISEMNPSSHPNNWEPWYNGDAEVYWVTRIYYNDGTDQPDMYNGKWDYDAWVFTWTGWHASTPWETVGHSIANAPKSTTSLQFIQLWELDPIAHDGLFNNPWYSWDCDSNWPLVGWAINIMCDLFGNVVNWGGNDDWIGTVNLNLTTSEQVFSGNGVAVKMYYKSE